MPPCRTPRILQLVISLAILAVISVPLSTARAALTGAALDQQIARIKQLQRDQLREGMHHIAEARERATERDRETPVAHARRHAQRTRRAKLRSKGRLLAHPIPRQHGKRGDHARPAPPEIDARQPDDHERHATELGARALNATPSNVKANNSTTDDPRATQSETSIASWNGYVLVAWNDGQGSATGTGYQGYGYSVDGGATFVDGGDPPKLPGSSTFVWSSDPVTAVNEKTGEFYYCGLADIDATHNGIAVARGHFAGSSLVWDGVSVVRSVSNSTAFLDKQWMAADSATGNVYVSNTTFTTTGDQIDFYRSTDGGATWSAAAKLSSVGDNGWVQGSRVVTGPVGEVWVTWQAIGQGTAQDYFRVRRSTNAGVSFGSQVTAASYIANFGTGAPGFNRERGITFPSLAVDRTRSANRGRAYLAWNEAYNFQDDAFNTGVVRTEVEGNNTPALGTPFNPGDQLSGTTSSVNPPDLDYWSVHLNAGQSLSVWADSLPASQTYTLRLFAPSPDSAQRLAFGGDINADASVSQAMWTFTAPVTGTYALRMAPAFSDTTSSKTGHYHISTAVGVRAGERGRDQRDVFVSSSDDGVTWSTPVRANDDAVGYDDYLPEVTVGADGDVYVDWYDFRDDPFGSRANAYLSRSEDGGATWAAAQRLSSVSSNWTTTLSNLAPNMGDYIHLWADERSVRPIWSDGRDGSADVYTTHVETRAAFAAIARDTSGAHGTLVALDWALVNGNALFANAYTWRLVDARGWTLPSGNLTLPAGGAGAVHAVVSVPDSAAGGTNPLTLEVTNARGTRTEVAVTMLTVSGSLSAGPAPALAFALGNPRPNPARTTTAISFTLPREADATLAVYGLRGERMRTLTSGRHAAGQFTMRWDGVDDAGRAVSPGTYFYRLQSGGQSAVRRVVWMK